MILPEEGTATVKIDLSNIQHGARCAVAIGYDVDMPGDFGYLYDRDVPWQPGDDGPCCHGHLNEDVLNYVRRLVTIADHHGVKLPCARSVTRIIALQTTDATRDPLEMKGSQI